MCIEYLLDELLSLQQHAIIILYSMYMYIFGKVNPTKAITKTQLN